MKKRIFSILGLTIGLVTVREIGYAMENKSLEVLPEVVVTATRTEVPLENIPGRVIILKEDEIEKISSAISKVDEILQYVSGLNSVRGLGIYSLVSRATLRGLSDEQSRTLVLVDGVPINKSDTGEVNFNRINLNEIERIEIFKGPASSIYGNNAMGGVINIITKKPLKPISGFASAFYGTYDTFGGNFEISGRTSKDKGIFYRLSGHYLNSDGYISKPPEKRDRYTVERFAKEFIGGFTLGYDFNKNTSLTFRAEFFDDKRGEGTKIYAKDGVSRDFDTQFYFLNYKGELGKFKWQTLAFYQFENYKRISESIRRVRGIDRYTRFDVDSERKDLGGSIILSYSLNPKNLITVGLDLKEGSVEAWDIYKTSPDRAYNKGKLRLIGFWIQDEIELLNGKLYLLPSLRFDYAKFYDGNFFSTISPFNRLSGNLEPNSWTHLSPRMGIKYKFNKNFDTYLSYGRGFRASILDDLCRSGILWGIYKIANPDLKPEKIDSFELGFNYFPSQKISISTSLYYSVGKDFLYFIPTGEILDGRPLYRRENIGKVKSYGGEVDINFKLSPNFKVFVNYTHTKAYISEFKKQKAFEGQDLTRTPRHQLKAGLFHVTPFFNYSLFGIYKSKQYVYTNEPRGEIGKVDGYTAINGKVWKEIFKNALLSVNVENIFNKRYMESADERAPGRFITVNFMYKF
ncbi:MAG: TonB-dependent receptor [Thermodesulfobacteriaceae bacterium]|nr:TonB-dependent receptor [Thermodesulfobacteriaceae bacterium]MCX8042358.1 TonB-dependent receptor [Thermodesulfobacteriaceae bacterium]MDW8135324.1 TonB-dependent receptor [Thermodesulfobacterium sp.]